MRKNALPTLTTTGGAVALAVTLVTGCTSDSDGPNAPTSSPSRHQDPAGTSDRDDHKLGAQVQQALGTTQINNSDGLFVEAGLEHVGDGFHSRPDLERGHSNQLTVTCEGKGHVRISVALKKPLHRTLACDGAVWRELLTAPGGAIKIDGEGMKGATGMVGWRLDKAGE